MTNIVNTGNASVDALAEMNISGNVTPVNWYKTILRENSKPYLLAICVLSEIVYWYRPVEVRDEHSGMTIGYRKKFREDLLQKTYNDFAEQFGESRRSVKAAFDRLEEITYPITPSGTGVKTDTMDRMDEVRSFIKDNIDYDVLLQCHPTEKMDINELVELMVETIAVK